MTTTNTTPTQQSTAPVGFWKRLGQAIRRVFKREKAGCCAHTSTTSGAASGQQTKAAA